MAVAKISSALPWPRAAASIADRSTSRRAISTPSRDQAITTRSTWRGSTGCTARTTRPATCASVRKGPPETAMRASSPSSANAVPRSRASRSAAKMRGASAAESADPPTARSAIAGGGGSGARGGSCGSIRTLARSSTSVPFTQCTPRSSQSFDHCSPAFTRLAE